MTDWIESYTEELGRSVSLRQGTSDEQGWVDVFVRRYHVPPPEMPNPQVVLDLGANIGLTAASYAAMWPDALVWMVEPSPENMALARRNAPTCPPLQCAVWRDSRWCWLYEEGFSADAYTVAELTTGAPAPREVYAIGLAVLVEILGEGRGVDFAKMDVEGAEWEILKPDWDGHDFPDVRHLLVEFHDEPRDGPAIIERGVAALEALGYEARHHEPHPQAVWAVRR